MKMIVFAVVCFLVASCAMAEDILAPVVWLHGKGTATTAEVYVASFWWQQFPDREDSDGRQLAIVCPKAYWQSWTSAKRAAVLDAFEKLLGGEVQVTRANLAIWKQRFEDAGINVELVLPGESTTIGAKLYVIVIGLEGDAAWTLYGNGLQPRDMEMPK
jgi:hypothetical protein